MDLSTPLGIDCSTTADDTAQFHMVSSASCSPSVKRSTCSFELICSSPDFELSHHAREETLCMVLESQAQASQRSEEFLEMMAMDQRAGVWPVDEGGSSGSSGPAVPEDVEEGETCEKACGADSYNSNRPRRTHGQRACRVQDFVSRVLHRTWPNASTSCRWKRDHDSSDCH